MVGRFVSSDDYWSTCITYLPGYNGYNSRHWSKKPLPAQIGEATLYGGIISPLALDLLGVAILILLFHEAGNAVIGHLEYAVMLPDASKSDRNMCVNSTM